MTITLDTNVIIAAFISRGHCHELFEHVARHHTIVLSDCIIEEVRRVLAGKFRMPEDVVERAVSLVAGKAILVQPEGLDVQVCRDPDDDWILATALAAKAGCIVSGANDLVELVEFRGIPIIKPTDFWAFEAEG